MSLLSFSAAARRVRRFLKNKGSGMKLSRIFSLSFVSLGLLLAVGCGGPEIEADPAASAPPVVSGKDQIKQRLQSIIDSGSGGSAVGGLRDALEELKKTDAALAEGLLKDLALLEPMQDSNQIKGMAQRMFDKLK